MTDKKKSEGKKRNLIDRLRRWRNKVKRKRIKRLSEKLEEESRVERKELEEDFGEDLVEEAVDRGLAGKDRYEGKNWIESLSWREKRTEEWLEEIDEDLGTTEDKKRITKPIQEVTDEQIREQDCKYNPVED